MSDKMKMVIIFLFTILFTQFYLYAQDSTDWSCDTNESDTDVLKKEGVFNAEYPHSIEDATVRIFVHIIQNPTVAEELAIKMLPWQLII